MVIEAKNGKNKIGERFKPGYKTKSERDAYIKRKIARWVNLFQEATLNAQDGLYQHYREQRLFHEGMIKVIEKIRLKQGREIFDD